MANPLVIEVFKGEQVYETVTIRDASLDVTGASSLELDTEDPLFGLGLAASPIAGEEDKFRLTCPASNTVFAPTGMYKVRAFGNWSGAPSKRMIAEMYLDFKPGLID